MEKKIQTVKINNQFSFKSSDRLGKGSFGQIFKGINIKTQEEVAIKIESTKIEIPQLLHEYKILKLFQNTPCFPKIYLFTQLDDTLVMIMELFDKNLEEILKSQPSKIFSKKTIIMIGIQLLKRIKDFHELGFIHRDIKPENFVIGLKKNKNLIYMIDYGISKRYIDSKTKEHINYQEGKKIVGTVKFASLYTHLGIEQSRRDDLESLAYILIYFWKGTLPWVDIKGKNKKEKYNKILDKKKDISSKELGKDFPIEFAEILDYFKNLGYTEDPDYEICKRKLLKVIQDEKLKFDYIYDWTTFTNLKDRNKLKKNKTLQRMLTINFLNTEENKNNHENKTHIIEENESEEEEEEEEDNNSEKIKIEDLDDNKKNSDSESESESESNITNKADIDEFDSPGLNPKNETECCLM